MNGSFGAATATELTRPDFAGVAAAFDVPATVASPETLHDALRSAWGGEGPNVVVLPTHLSMFAPTHQG